MTAYRANILVVDDEESMREGCAQTLAGEGYRVETVSNGENGLEAVARKSFDAVVLDLQMPGLPGIEFLKRVHKGNPRLPVVIITGYGTIGTAVEAMQRGARDFLTKPFTPEALVSAVDRVVGERLHVQESAATEFLLNSEDGSEALICRSPGMMNVVQLVRKVAPSDSTVLVYGETGVGKELVTRTIHRLSKRRDKAFVTVDCGTLVETLFESEMFGHVKGAFTGAAETTRGKFEIADGGTIFLDEIANVSMNMQARLLRVLQEREFSRVGSHEKIRVDVRIAAATNRNLLKEIAESRFREDLFYRLNVVPIHVPALRERREDIPALAMHFLRSFSAKRGSPVREMSKKALQYLESQDWPGNVRELKNLIERALVTCDEPVIDDVHLMEFAAGKPPPPSVSDGSLSELEQKEIARVLTQFDGNRSKAAEYLGINRKTLREKMRKYGIEP